MRFLVVGLALAGCSHATTAPVLTARDATGVLTVDAVSPDVVRIEFDPNGVTPTPTAVMDPNGLRKAHPVGTRQGDTLSTKALSAQFTPDTIQVQSADGRTTLSIDRNALDLGQIRLRHGQNENLYGMRGYTIYIDKTDPRLSLKQGLLRNQGAPVSAGGQGDGGSPFAYTTKWGLFVDSVDGDFANNGDTLKFTKGSRKDVEAYIVIGPPKRTIETVTRLSGRPPMMPKWSLGFMNSQWGTTQAEVESIVDEYRQKQIPIDAFILDFDFKAWGEDNYGEWRWNSTSGPGNVGPNKYPDGQSGKFARDMRAKGVRIVGIMKPRILIQNVDKQNTRAATEALANHWFLPDEKPYDEYFSHRPAADLDFSKPEVRQWYWKHAEGLFKTGIVGWWNDEADYGFDSLGFLHMEQSLYEGQRSISNERVFSLNRNWYLGSQRYAFGTWSGDIDTGFASMRNQSTRMLATVDLDQPHWSMDSGGFSGHPSPENYARWLEFASVVPIMRVHNTFGDHRQPWVYGPIAEAAAKKAIEMRYRLLPYFYACEKEASDTGVGIVRPLFWEFPDDALAANVTEEWMVGESILAAPVLIQGQTNKNVYLPPGTWFDMQSGQKFDGGQTITIPVDSTTWSDLPLFVRAGEMVPMGPVMQSTNDPAPRELTLHIWPDQNRPATFCLYDDDGRTYANEKGDVFTWNINARFTGNQLKVTFAKPVGRFHPVTQTLRVIVHGFTARSATLDSRPLADIGTQNTVTVVVTYGKSQVVALSP